jgi:hypothetical protein
MTTVIPCEGTALRHRVDPPADREPAVEIHGFGVVSGGKFSWPTRGPNVGETIGSAMQNGARRGIKSACK